MSSAVTSTTRPTTWKLFFLSTLIIGPIAALVLKGFEFLAIEGTVWWWNDLWHSDVERWRVVPLAMLGGVLFTLVALMLRQTRIPTPAANPLEEHGSSGKPTLALIGVTLLIGAISLVFAGASLGPEAPLMAFATLFGIWIAVQAGAPAAQRQYLALVSVGALLVAFLGSLIPVLLPLLMIARQAKLPFGQPALLLEKLRHNWQKALILALPVVGAALSSFFILWLFDPTVKGYGSIPVGTQFDWQDFILAPLVGAITFYAGWAIKKTITILHTTAVRVDKKVPVVIYALLAGLGVGVLYFIGGQTVQFSGSIGTHELVAQSANLGLVSLIVLLVVKLLVTAWSAAVGYRGGLVFPSIYIGTAIALIIGVLFAGSSTGVMIGAIAGIIAAMTDGAVGFLLVASILPPTAGLWFLALLAVIGSTLVQKIPRRS